MNKKITCAVCGVLISTILISEIGHYVCHDCGYLTPHPESSHFPVRSFSISPAVFTTSASNVSLPSIDFS